MTQVCGQCVSLRALIVSLTQSQSSDTDTVVHDDHQNTFTPKQTPQSEPTDHDLLQVGPTFPVLLVSSLE